MNNNKKIYILEGLGCANCAAKIEDKINKLEEAENANVNFASKTLYIELSKNTDIFKKIEEIVKSIEPDIEVIPKESAGHIHNHTKEENPKKTAGWIAVGFVLFIIPLIFQFPIQYELILFGLSYIIVGGKVVLTAGKNIFKGQVFDENFLMTVSTLGAFAIKEFPEAVAVMLFYRVGELLQDIAVDRSRKSITALMDIRPDFANLKNGNEILQVNPDEVQIGQEIVVKPGERVPLDGIVTEGKTMVDTSALTGESVPKTIGINDEVLAGFINKNGVVTVKVTKLFSESTISKILNMVENASSKKAPTEKFITKFAKYYTPIVVLLALIIAVIPPLILMDDFKIWIYRALIFLVISCPCALVISIPLGFFGGIGGASKKGILIKGGNYLEALNNVHTVVFDKTGTLTKGVFKVTEIVTANGYTADEILMFAAYAESYSNHPIAESIKEAYGLSIDRSRIEKSEELAGFGVKAVVDGKTIMACNDKMLHLDDGISHDMCNVEGTVAYVVIDNEYAGYIIISDEIKHDAKTTIERLKDAGVQKIAMLTGDTKYAAQRTADELEIENVYAELLPDHKLERLEELLDVNKIKGKLVFVGDGINDAPVLARADIGIAMGGIGSDAAVEAADVVLMTDEPSKIVDAIKIAKKTKTIVWQNIIMALGVKAIVLMLGVLGIATMWEAVIADVGVAVLAVLNSIRAMRI
ncbi:MAG: heavy metal translocating P-type ATPase [Ignavibacteriales bacterium]